MARRSFTLQSVNLADAADIAKISWDSFASDRHTLMKAHRTTNIPYDHEDASHEPLADYLQRPDTFQLIKAVENVSGKTMGSVTWAFRGYTRENVPVLRGRVVDGMVAQQVSLVDTESEDASTREALPGKEARKNSDGKGRTEEAPQSTPEDDLRHDNDDPIKRLTSLTDADMKRWQDILMPEGTKCMIVVVLSVAPEHHGRGVGTALLRWGTANADADGVFCWVHSSESAHTFYAEEGFETVGTLDVDLDEFAPCPPNGEDGDGKWGHYVFRYMKRLPIEKARLDDR